MAADAMSGFLTNIGTFGTTAITWMGNVLDTIVASPALTTVCLAMPIFGFAVGLLKRMMSV